MRASKLCTLLSLVISAGCVSTTVTQKASQDVNFAGFKTASYTVHAIPTTEYGSDQKFSADEIGLFGTLLGRKLESMGYPKPAEGQVADFTVDVAVTASKEGSPAARFWVGMGAGRAVFLFDATFTAIDGHTIAGFQGGRSYTGMEIGHSFAGKEDIQVSAANRAVSQVEEFIKNNGNFPSASPTQPNVK